MITKILANGLPSTFPPHLREIRLVEDLAHVQCRLRHASRRFSVRRRTVVSIARPMRRSPSVHNALVLNLRSGDANVDVRGRSSCFLPSLFLRLSPSRSAFPLYYYFVFLFSSILPQSRVHYVHFLSFSFFLSFFASLLLSLSHPSCASCRRVLPLDWRFVTRNHTR